MVNLNQDNIIQSLSKVFIFFREDPRRLQFIFLWSYSFVALEFFNHERSHYITIITFLSALIFEKVFSYLMYKQANSWLPSAIVAPSICTLCYSPSAYPYVLAGVLSILSKSIFRYKGRHVFNPSNFGITVTILLFPNWLTGIINVFSGVKLIGIYFLITGLINAINSKTTHISIMYLVGIVIGFLIRGAFFDYYLTINTFINFALNPILLIFCFHMINDPATTPKSKSLGAIYGFILGLMYVTLSYFGLTHAHFYSLFAVTLFVPFMRDFEEKKLAVKI